MLKERTGRYVKGLNAPIIHFKNENIDFTMDWINKTIVDESIGEQIVLIKHQTTDDNLENIKVEDKVDMILDYSAIDRDYTDREFSKKQLYKNMYLINMYYTNNCSITDTVRIFSNVKEPKNLDRVMRRDEQEQSRNTIYKLKPNTVTYNVNSDFKDLNVDIKKFTEDLTKITKRQFNSR